ncbi:MAG TPA: MBL fold metallo-hydrolase, partial [Chitinophagaceae bacterium]|nr:MBL fold metallo-hydrolase [Chitinophagaceae bacterium]
DITDVFLTHLHFDHCGGSIKRDADKLVPNFPNATFWSNKEHWEWATVPNEREKASFLKENILPIQESGKLNFIDVAKSNESKLGEIKFSDKISVRFVNGHTQAMMLPQINYNGKTVVFVADLLPSAGHIPIPYIMAYDMQPLLSLQEKKSFLKEALEKDYILFFEHDKDHECCTLQQTERGIRAKEFFNLEKV